MNLSKQSDWKTSVRDKEATNRRWKGYKAISLLPFILLGALWIYLVLSPFGLPRTHIIAVGDGVYQLDSVESIPFVEFEKKKLANIDAIHYHDQDTPFSNKALLSPETKKGVNSKDNVIIFLYFRCAAINGEAYFITRDFTVGNPGVGLLPAKLVIDEIAKIPSKNKLVVLPAGSIHYDPRLGVFTDEFAGILTKSISASEYRSINVYFPHQNLEASNSSFLLKSSLTTYFFCEGIQGPADFNEDGQIDVREIAGYVSESTRNWINASSTLAPNQWSAQNAFLYCGPSTDPKFASPDITTNANTSDKVSGNGNGSSNGNGNSNGVKENTRNERFSDIANLSSYPLPIHLLGEKTGPKSASSTTKIESTYHALIELLDLKQVKDDKENPSSRPPTKRSDTDTQSDFAVKERDRLGADWLNLKSIWQRFDNLGQDRTKEISYDVIPTENINLIRATKKSVARNQQRILEDYKAFTDGTSPTLKSAVEAPGEKMYHEKILSLNRDRNQTPIDFNLYGGRVSKLHSLSLEEILHGNPGEKEKTSEILQKLLAEENPDNLKEWLDKNRSLDYFSEVNWSNHVLQAANVEWKDAQVLIKTRILSEKVAAMDAILPHVLRNRIIPLDRIRLQSEASIHELQLERCTMDRVIEKSVKVQQQYNLLLEDFQYLISVRRVWLTEFDSAEEILKCYCNPYSILQPDVSFEQVSEWIERLRKLHELLNRSIDIDVPYRAEMARLTQQVIKEGDSIRSKLFDPLGDSSQNQDEPTSRDFFDRQLLNCTSIPFATHSRIYLESINLEYRSTVSYQERDWVSQKKPTFTYKPVVGNLTIDKLKRQVERTILYLKYLGLIKFIQPSKDASSLSDPLEDPLEDLVKSIREVENDLYGGLRTIEKDHDFDNLSTTLVRQLRNAGEKVRRLLAALSVIGPPRADSRERVFQNAVAANLFTDWRDTIDWTRKAESAYKGFCLDTVIGFQSKLLSEQLDFFDEKKSGWARDRLNDYNKHLISYDPTEEGGDSAHCNLEVSSIPGSSPLAKNSIPIGLRHANESYVEFVPKIDELLPPMTFLLLIVFDTDCLEVHPVAPEDSLPRDIQFRKVEENSLTFPAKGSLISNPFSRKDVTSTPIRLRVVRNVSAKGASTPIEIFLFDCSSPVSNSGDSPMGNEVSVLDRLVTRRCIPIELPHGEIQLGDKNQTLVTSSYITNRTLFPNQSHTLRMSFPIQETCKSALFADVYPIDSRPSSRTPVQWDEWVSTQTPLMRITASDNEPTDKDLKRVSPPGSSESVKPSATDPKASGFTGLLCVLGFPNDDTRTLRFVDFDIARPQEYLKPRVSFDSNINRLRIDFDIIPKSDRMQLGPIDVRSRLIGVNSESVMGKTELIISPDRITTNRLQFEFSDPMPQALRLEIDIDYFPRAFVYSVDTGETRLDIQPVSSQPNIELDGLDDLLFLSMNQANKLIAKIDLQASNEEINGSGVSVVQESIDNGLEPVVIAKMTDDRQTALDLTVLPTPGTVRVDSHVSDFQIRFPPDALYDRPTRIIASVVKDGLKKPIRSVPVFIDTQPPTIESFDLSPPTRIFSVGDTPELSISVADKGSGVASVDLAAIDLDLEKPPADSKWIPATLDADNHWKCSPVTGEKAAKLHLFVRATDAVGNKVESRLTPITVITKGKSEVERKLRLSGRVLHRGKPVENGSVTLVAETKTDEKTKPKELRASIKTSGSYLLEGVPKGKYIATIKLIINNKVILAKQELDLSATKTLNINQDLSTDKAQR
jgi:hypothetical protein